ncbi:hypothetical protein LR48_Vigan10g002800 [Vigna angularis]|uniref:UDP N-acetylglucosamine O-acyltransferase C-terminal domain-containing protein n=1 Tax=Phaseolus angularis TaxID=3914 RepID=A0A0L9VGE5_PHAAN|nr:hypothetical protein LR48_Vigan10g002800 [Vigna angularis]
MAGWLLKARSRCRFSLSSALHHPRFIFFFSQREHVHTSTLTKPSFIDPTAAVHPDALIGQGVSIGPFCSVSSSAKLGNGCRLYPGSHVSGRTELGDNCTLMTGAVVGDDYPGCTVIGSNNSIGYHAVIGVKCQDMKHKPEDECFLEIGDNNDIREHTSIHRSSKSTFRTVIGNGNLIMGSCHIAHDCKIGDNNIFANNTLLAGHVEVEIRNLRTAYRKIFMSFDANAGSLEERIAEVELHEELGHVPAVRAMLQSIRNSIAENRRGICRIRHWNVS